MLSAIVTAAGLSQRMKSDNKLLLPLHGKNIITIVVDNIIHAGVDEVIIVTGHQQKEVKDALKDFPVKIVYNPSYEKGITTSIQCGVEYANGNGYMICLSDMPLITAEEYALLKNTFDKQVQINNQCICVPVYQEEKGNPVIFSSYYKKIISEHTYMEGCKHIIEENKKDVYWIEMPSIHILKDVDNLEDYKAIEALNNI